MTDFIQWTKSLCQISELKHNLHTRHTSVFFFIYFLTLQTILYIRKSHYDQCTDSGFHPPYELSFLAKSKSLPSKFPSLRTRSSPFNVPELRSAKTNECALSDIFERNEPFIDGRRRRLFQRHLETISFDSVGSLSRYPPLSPIEIVNRQ